jgi:hypothetical protein
LSPARYCVRTDGSSNLLEVEKGSAAGATVLACGRGRRADLSVWRLTITGKPEASLFGETGGRQTLTGSLARFLFRFGSSAETSRSGAEIVSAMTHFGSYPAAGRSAAETKKSPVAARSVGSFFLPFARFHSPICSTLGSIGSRSLCGALWTAAHPASDAADGGSFRGISHDTRGS